MKHIEIIPLALKKIEQICMNFKQRISINFHKFQFILIIFLVLSISIITYAQEKLEVDGDLEIESTASDQRHGLILKPIPDLSKPDPALKEGQIYYNDDDNRLYYSDGANWQSFGAGGDKTVATKIVAASNSLDTTRADYACDGTDDQQMINRAINALPADGGAVYLLEGTFNISAALLEGETITGIVPHTNTAIIGTGAGTVLKIVTGANNVNVINASSVSGILISQLKIDGNNNTGGSNYGIKFNSVFNSKIQKVWINNINAGGICLSASNDNIISENDIWLNTTVGIYMSTNSPANIISNNNIRSNGQGGIVVWDSSNNVFSNNNIQANGGHGIGLQQLSPNSIISNNNIQSNNGYGILIATWSNNSIISGNNIQANSFTGINISATTDTTISNNIISSNTRDGIELYDSQRNNIVSNIISDNGGVLEYYGIWVRRAFVNSCDNNIISTNRIYDSNGTGYGIKITFEGGQPPPNNTYLIGNLIDGAGYIGAGYDRRIQDSGTSTKYTQKEKITIERQAAVAPAAGSTLDVSTNPKSYVPLAPTSPVTLNATTAIADGKAIGDILILEGTSDTNTVTVPGNANTFLGAANRVLGLDDTLKLLWNGTDWIELGYSNN